MKSNSGSVGVASILLGLLLLVSILADASAEPRAAKYAYVTIHYEGTNRDAEYVLGIRVLAKSLKASGSSGDFVVLASETVGEKTRRIFKEDGIVVRDVKNLDNPFFKGKGAWNPNFQFTLNKLHAWQMTEYERVIFLDADNIILEKMDELFRCGEFCVVFQNPCHFHTGLIVITPSERQFKDLNESLYKLTSFDGADQGFLSAYYKGVVARSPLFVGQETEGPAHKAMRLPAGYNLNHKFFYEMYDWSLFRVHHFKHFRIPALSLGFPMTPLLKPWYWWACFVLDLHWEWHHFRYQLHGDESYVLRASYSTLLCLLLALFFYILLVRGKTILESSSSFGRRILSLLRSGWTNHRRFARLLLCALSLYIYRLCGGLIDPLTPPILAFSLLLFYHNLFLAAGLWSRLREGTRTNGEKLSVLGRALAYCCLSEAFTILMSWQRIFPNILIKGVFLVVAITAILAVQLWAIESVDGLTDKRDRERKKKREGQDVV